MGTLTESFGNLSDYLLSEHKKNKKHSADVELLFSSWLKPLCPSGIRCGSGTLTDLKDRQVGPLDLIATTESFPPFNDGSSSIVLADGAVFCLEVKDWSEHDLTDFGLKAQGIKALECKKKSAIPCLAVSFAPLPLPELSQFLKSQAGQSVDGVFCIGHHVVVRNNQGLYGNPSSVPFVTEQSAPEALKAFTFFLLQLCQSSLNIPFGLSDYQHL